jgi:hypothetical protein
MSRPDRLHHRAVGLRQCRRPGLFVPPVRAARDRISTLFSWNVSRYLVAATLPIRLRRTPATCWVRPVAGIKLGIGRRLYITGDAEQRAESVERVEASVEAKREFVEVGL